MVNMTIGIMENLLKSKEYWQVLEHVLLENNEGFTDEQQKELDVLKQKELKTKKLFVSSH